jgi:hypothetical protein
VQRFFFPTNGNYFLTSNDISNRLCCQLTSNAYLKEDIEFDFCY